MFIHTRTVFNMATMEVIEDEGFEYHGPLALADEDPLAGAEDDPPAGAPPAGAPPAGDPPAGDPPAGDPPAGDPPGESGEVQIPPALQEIGVDKALVDAALPLIQKMSKEDQATLTNLGLDLLTKKTEQDSSFWQEQSDIWVKELQDDPEIGGEKLDRTLSKVNLLIGKFDTNKELVQYLESINHQNCAPLVRFLARITPHFSEDELVTNRGSSGNKGEVPDHQKMGYKPVDEYSN